jgi:hypothetical protein
MDAEFERMVHHALKECGWLLPETPGEIRRAELELEAHEIELPAEIRDPFRVLERYSARKMSQIPKKTAVPSQPLESVSLPAALLAFAREIGLNLEKTLKLFKMQSQIIAHRSSTKKDELSREDWERFYKAVKEYL